MGPVAGQFEVRGAEDLHQRWARPTAKQGPAQGEPAALARRHQDGDVQEAVVRPSSWQHTDAASQPSHCAADLAVLLSASRTSNTAVAERLEATRGLAVARARALRASAGCTPWA